MELYLKLGTLPMKRYQTRDYKSIEVNDKIDVFIRGNWELIKIDKIYDEIPMKYFGGYV